jgi:hypothetical protein
MVALRYAYLLGLVLLLGGLVSVGGVVAPAIFASLTASQGQAGREVAGLAFGAVLARFHAVAFACLAVMLAAMTLIAALGPRPVKFAIRMSIVLFMTAATLYSGLVVSRQIESVRREIDGVVADLPAGDQRRIRFGQLHGLSTVLLSFTAVGGFALLYWEARAHE